MPFVRNYVDDLLIASSNLEEHLHHMQAIFEVLAKAKLSLNLKKCRFAQDQVYFLGFAVDANGFRLPPEKIEAIVKYSRPHDISGLRRFLGLINFITASSRIWQRLRSLSPTLCRGRGGRIRIRIRIRIRLNVYVPLNFVKRVSQISQA